MRTLARWITCGAALVAAIGPAAATGLAGAHMRAREDKASGPTHQIPVRVLEDGSGLGSGTWNLPAAGNGSASMTLFDESGHPTYVVRANLRRSGERPPKGMPEQGGFEGILVLIERDGSRVPVAEVLGKWICEPDGSGTFGVDILVRTEHIDEPLVAIGTIEGVLRGSTPSRGATGAPGLQAPSEVARFSRLSATWVLAQ